MKPITFHLSQAWFHTIVTRISYICGGLMPEAYALQRALHEALGKDAGPDLKLEPLIERSVEFCQSGMKRCTG